MLARPRSTTRNLVELRGEGEAAIIPPMMANHWKGKDYVGVETTHRARKKKRWTGAGASPQQEGDIDSQYKSE